MCSNQLSYSGFEVDIVVVSECKYKAKFLFCKIFSKKNPKKNNTPSPNRRGTRHTISFASLY